MTGRGTRKVLLVGPLFRGSLVLSYMRWFKRLGFDVSAFDDEGFRKRFLGRIDSSITRYGLAPLWAPAVGVRLEQHIVKTEPDFVLVFKGKILHPYFLRRIKNRYPDIPLVNYVADDPFNNWSRGVSSPWVRASIPIFDLYLVFSNKLCDKIKAAGAKKVGVIPFAFDEEDFDFGELKTEIVKCDLRVTFCATGDFGKDRSREEVLDKLDTLPLKIWGEHWDKSRSAIVKKSWMGAAALGRNYVEIVKRSTISLNILRRQNYGMHNMKTFEIPGMGGFMLATRSQEQQAFFKEGIEAEYFSTHEELLDKCRYYLKTPSAVARIRRQASIAGRRHTYKDRVQKLLSMVKGL